MAKRVVVTRTVVENVLVNARVFHPREGLLLLRGNVERDFLLVDEVLIPPFAVHGTRFATFPLHMLPLDFSIVGTAHSHPSGILTPSTHDLNHFYGRVMIVAAYPYASALHIGVFNREGTAIAFTIRDNE